MKHRISQATELYRFRVVVDTDQNVEINTLLASNGVDLSGLSACNAMSPDNVYVLSSTGQLDCLHLDLAEGDRDIYSGLEHNVSQQFCPVIQTNMYYK